MKIKTWQIITVIICIMLGTLLHYTYELSGKNIIVGFFSAVNESTWEHLKLIYIPFLVMAIVGYFVIGNKANNYWFAQALGIITAIIFTIVFFYTYTGIIGENFAWLNIATFVISVIIGGDVTYKLLISKKTYNAEFISIVFLIILLFNFILYTFNPPRIQLFRDPISGKYGI